MRDVVEMVYKVTHTKNDVETIGTVYLVTAASPHEAKTVVLDALYERHFFRAETPERLANDPFGLLAAGQNGSWTNGHLCRVNNCSVTVQLFRPDVYKLYAINTKTGEMS